MASVVYVHTGRFEPGDLQPFLPWMAGAAGVRLFFVLSGYLITGILLDARARAAESGVSRGQVWLAFWLRRALRIFPLGYAAIALAWVFGAHAARADGWWYVTYTTNILAALRGENAAGLGHFWSLAVEEQFYLIWPLLLLWCPTARLGGAMWMLISASALVRGVLVGYGHPFAAYVLMPSRLDALAFGGFVALRARQVWPLLVGGALLLLLGALTPPSVAAMANESGMIAWSAAAIIYAARGTHGVVGRVLSAPPLTYLGTISYGIYVLHFMVPDAVRWAQRTFNVWLRLPDPGPARLLYVSVVSVVTASISWVAFERPLNDLKRYVPYVPPKSSRASGMREGSLLGGQRVTSTTE